MTWLRGFVASIPRDADEVAARLSESGNSAELYRADDAVIFAFAGRDAPDLASCWASLVGLEHGVAGIRIVNEGACPLSVTPCIGITMSLVVAATDSDQARWSPFLKSLWRGLRPEPDEVAEDEDFIVYRWDRYSNGGLHMMSVPPDKRLTKIAEQMKKEAIAHFACTFDAGFFSTTGNIDESSLDGSEYPGPTATVSLRWTAAGGNVQEIGINDSGECWYDGDAIADAIADVDLGFLGLDL